MTEQQVLALIAGEMRKVADTIEASAHCWDAASKEENHPMPQFRDAKIVASNALMDAACEIRKAFPVPTAPPPAAESEEEVVERVADAIRLAELKGRDFDDIARAAIAAVKGGGGE